jgi:hypothetical protein
MRQSALPCAALPNPLGAPPLGEGEDTLVGLRGKTSRVKLREHDAEAMEGQRQAEAEIERTPV